MVPTPPHVELIHDALGQTSYSELARRVAELSGGKPNPGHVWRIAKGQRRTSAGNIDLIGRALNLSEVDRERLLRLYAEWEAAEARA